MSKYIKKLPGIIHDKTNKWIFIPFLVLTVISIILVTKIDISGMNFFEPPKGDSYFIQNQLFKKWFSDSEYLVISVDRESLFSDESTRLIKEITQTAGDIPGITTVFSSATLDDSTGNSEEAILKSELLSRFLISTDGKAQNIYIFFESDINRHKIISGLFDSLKLYNNDTIHISGKSIIDYYIETEILYDFLKLGLIAVLIILAIQIRFTGSLVSGIILLLSSLISILWTLALFPIMKIALEPANTVVPVISLVLSTSYNIHLFHYFRIRSNDPIGKTLDYSSLVIGMAALTTIIGFGPLIFSSIYTLRMIGLLLFFGIGFSFFITLYLIPSLLTKLKPEKIRKKIVIQDYVFSVRKLIFFSIFILIIIAGINFVSIASGFKFFFRENSAIDKKISYTMERSNGTHYLNLVIDTESEYGLVNPETYNSIAKLTKELRDSSFTKSVVSFTDFVVWANGQLYGDGSSLEPKNENEIGEILEILNSNNSGFNINSLIDISYSKTTVQITYADLDLSGEEKEKLLKGIETEISSFINKYLPGKSWFLISFNHRYQAALSGLVRNLIPSSFMILAVLFIVMILIFRSIKLASISIIPALTSVLVYFGLMGWFGFTLDIENIVLLAIVLGVSNDDIIMFMVAFQQRIKDSTVHSAIVETKKETGSAILQTTAIIVIGISVLFFSSFTNFYKSIILCILSLAFATFVTLIIIPAILELVYKKKKMEIKQ